MNIGILGSGVVAKTLGAKLASLGQSVMLGSRDPGKLAEWLAEVGEAARAGSFAEAAAHAEVVINATAGLGSLEALAAAGAGSLSGKILLDIANPLDFSQGFPPSLSVANTDSLGEQIQRAYPAARVVKTLNTLTASLMVDPRQLAGGDHHLFLSGNDAEAKAQVRAWLGEWFGWEQIIDLGDITTARGTEMLLPIWVRLMGALGTPKFNFKIVQG
ncbi:MAG: NAD(P)-binding domain-containing protein [Chloroflexales bacterium]|nr:NAD(P)-binding domain-containing protein [Chloroflexales bacterium]